MNCGCVPPYIGPSVSNTCANSSIAFMTMVNLLITNSCNVSQLCERMRSLKDTPYGYDYIVIGGGSTGSVVAARLLESMYFTVLVIEAGNEENPASQVPSFAFNFLGDPHMDWNYKTEPEPSACLGYEEGQCTWPRGKVLGGTGVIHGMTYMRGTVKDYADWEAAGNPGWNYESLLRIFKKSEDNEQTGPVDNEDVHGVGGPMPTSRFPYQPEPAEDVLKAAEELGYIVSNDLNGKQRTGFAIAQTNSRNGVRFSSAKAFLRPQRKHRFLHMLLNTTVTKVNLKRKNNIPIVSGVNVLAKGGMYTIKARKGIIVSAGVVNSPQLLLLSGIGPEDQLDKLNIKLVHNLPGVGQNLHDQVSFSLNFIMTKRKAEADLNEFSLTEYVSNQTGPMSCTGMAQVTALINTNNANSSETNPNLQLFFSGYIANCSECLACSDNAGNRILTISPVVLRPKSRGFLTLKTKNHFDRPLIYAGYLKEQEDVKVLIDGIRIALQLANTSALGTKYGLTLRKENYGTCATKFTYNSDKFWECAIRWATMPANHQAGTCKMGPATDPLAVVDSDLQVHGIKGLYVMDASIMPHMVSGSPHATCVAIGEKGAETILRKAGFTV